MVEEQSKLKEWTKRYALPEIAGTTGNFLGPWLAYQFADNALLAGGASAVLGNIMYSTTLSAEQIYADVKKAREQELDYGIKGLATSLGKITTEIGSAMTIDTFVTRTPITAFFIDQLGGKAGTVVGKLASDSIWYAQSIGIYECLKRMSSK